LDAYEKERNKLGKDYHEHILQTIFLDSVSIDSSLSESLMVFLKEANHRENDAVKDQEFLMDYQDMTSQGKIFQKDIPVVLPNSNIVLMPSDLFLIFEAESLKDSSPLFISQVGLILTEQDEIEWKHIYKRSMQLFLSRHKLLFFAPYLQQFSISSFFDECYKEFLEPFMEKIESHQKIQQWAYFNLKSSVI